MNQFSALEKLTQNGYVTFHLEGANSLIDQVNSEIEDLVSSGNFRTNSRIYSYNDSPRIVESWRHSPAAKSLAKHPQIIALLSDYFGSSIRPFSTINFLRSTEQPLHSDYVHFGTVPSFQLAAAWIALEDIDPRSGPIQVVPGSHKWPEFEYAMLGLPIARSIGDVRRYYTLYESWVTDELQRTCSSPITPELKKGDAIVWLANLLHGSPNCEDNTLTRRSQVTHYYTESAEIHYNPAFSRPSNSQYARRIVEFID